MTRGPLIHGALLVAALLFAYQTWTRDDTPAVDRGEFALWSQPEDSFKALVYETSKKTVRLERRGEGDDSYLWATVTREVERPKPTPPEPTPEPAPADSAESSAGTDKTAADEADGTDKAADDKADDDKADGTDKAADDNKADDGAEPKPDAKPDKEPAAPKPPEMIVETKVDEFPVGSAGKTLVEAVAPLMALRDLGAPNGKELDTFGLAKPELTLSVEYTSGTRTLEIGGRVYGGSDRYVRDPSSGKVYVIDGSQMRVLEGGDSSLRDNRLIAAARDDIKAASIIVGDARRDIVRVSKASADRHNHNHGGGAFWAPASEPDKEDPTLTNFMSRVEKLVPLDFEADVEASTLTEIASFEYRDDDGKALDTVTVFRAAGTSPDKPEYYGKSRHTRVYARLNRPLTRQIEEDLTQVTETAE